MTQIRLKLRILIDCILSSIRDWRLVCKGQNVNAEILQIAHRLEKGLLIVNPRDYWGWEKAKALRDLIPQSELTEGAIGRGVLYEFISEKKLSSNADERKMAETFVFPTAGNVIEGGKESLVKNQLSEKEKEQIKSFFFSRHSVRSFNDKPVSTDLLNDSIEIALRCPSACNRQPFHVYVVNRHKKEKHISNNSSIQADKYLYITGDISSFTPDEFNDWIVSPSIFIGYLVLALHLNGIGSCIIRKDLIHDSGYNKKVREYCNIPKNEKLIIEIAIGNYDSGVVVPKSQRKDINDIVTYL